jgi:hypothetical protein
MGGFAKCRKNTGNLITAFFPKPAKIANVETEVRGVKRISNLLESVKRKEVI